MKNMMHSWKENKIIWLAGLLLIAVFMIWIFAYQAKIANTDSENNGKIIIDGVDSNTKVFVDSERAKVIMASSGGIISAPSGRRAILVSKDGYWPWLKYVIIDSGQVTEINPFIIAKNASPEIILQSDPEYEKLVSQIINNEPPSSPQNMYSSDKSVSIWTKNGSVFAKWTGGNDSSNPPPYFCVEKCSNEIEAFHSEATINNLAFLDGRNDVAIVSLGPSIYALELDRREVQNFEPVYTGSDPRFYKAPDETLYIWDDNQLKHVVL